MSFEQYFLSNHTSKSDEWFYKLDKIHQKRNINPEWNYRSKQMMKRKFKDGVKWRMERDIVSNILVVGETGSGKTNVAYRLAYFVAKTYGITDLPFVKIGKHLDMRIHRVLKEFGRNSVIIVEEAEEVINRMRSNSNKNLNFAVTLDSIRKYNVHFIFVCPDWDKLDRSIVQSAINWLFTVSYNDHDRKRVKARLEYNCRNEGLTSQSYEFHTDIWFPWLPRKLFNNYEKLINAYHDSIEKDHSKEMKSWDNRQKEKQEDNKKLKMLKILNKCKDELSKHDLDLSNSTSQANEIKKDYGIKLVLVGASTSEIQGLLKVGWATAKEYDVLAIAEKGEEKKKEREEKG